jgi:glyoxylate carboligase
MDAVRKLAVDSGCSVVGLAGDLDFQFMIKEFAIGAHFPPAVCAGADCSSRLIFCY